MNKNRKTSHILNVFQYDNDGHVILPASLTLTVAPASNDNSGKVGTTAWVRTYVTGLSYLTGNQSISVSGDATGSGTTAISLTLANSGVTAGTYGSATLVPVVTVDAKGRVTSVTTAAISGSLTFTGDVTGTGTTGTSTGLTLAASGVIAGTYTKVTVDTKGRVTVGASATTSDISEGTNLYYTDARVLSYLTANTYATQSYVGTQVANLVAAAPATLDTLNELAAALGNDPSFATTVSTSIGTKVPQTRTLTINGTGYDLSADRSWTINSMVYPSAGIALSTGTAWGTSITDNSANWNTAFGWGNHASGGYLTSATAATTYASLTGAYANPAFVASLAYSKITGVPAFLTSYTETDPYRVTSVAVSGTSTKTITLTRADASTVTTTWTDYDTDTNTYVTSAGFSGGNLTLTRNDTGQITVSLDGRYYLATNPSGYLTGITSGQVTGALGFTPYNATNPSGYISSYTETDTLATVTARGATTTAAITTGLLISQGPGGNYNENIRLPGSTAVISFNTSGATGAGSYNIVSQTTFQIRNAGGTQVFIMDQSGNLAMTGTLGGSNFSGTHSGNSSGTNTGDQTNISGNAATVTNGVYTNSSQNNLSGILNFGSSGATPYSNPTGTSNGISFGGIESSSLRTYGIFTEQENIGGNYSKLTFNYHTGIRLGASSSYGGTRFYNNFAGGAGGGSETFSVNNGDNHVRVAYNLYVGGTISGSNLSGTNTGDQTNISGNSATTSQTTFGTLTINGSIFCNANNDLSTSAGGISFWSTGPVTTSWTGFKNNASTGWGYHGGSTATGGYSTYHIMDTTSRGWIWRYATPGGTNFAGTNVASIQTNNGAMSLGAEWDGSASRPIFAQLNIAQGVGGTGNWRDIDLRGSWGAGEGHSITATHGNGAADIVGQFTFQHDSPGSRIKLGKLYNSGNQSSYPWQLISDGNTGVSGAWVTLSGGDWSVTRYGPNTTWGAYLYVGAGTQKSGSGAAAVISTDGNLHLDCASNSKQIYMNYYSGGSAIGAYGPINCTYDVTAFSSDRRLKTNIQVIDHAVEKVMGLTGMTYDWNTVGSQYGWNPKNIREAGVFAQEIEAVLPEAVRPAPFDTDADGNSISGEHFLTVKYEKIVPLLIEAIKEQQGQIEELKRQIEYLVENK